MSMGSSNESQSPLSASEIRNTPTPVRAKSGSIVGSIFSKWSEEDKQKSKLSETKSAKLWRKVGRFAGLPMPYGVEQFNALIEKYGTVENVKRFWFPDNFQGLMVGKVRGHNMMPFDIYTLIKQGSMPFIMLLVFIYAFMLCGTFALLASPAIAGCFEVNAANFIAKGFLLVSGLGNGMEQSDVCLWIEVGGTLIGVYITLPIIGAIVLVRLLDNTAISFAMSHVVLLGLRDGRPSISVRSISRTGTLYCNRLTNIYFALKTMDKVTGEGYGTLLNLSLPSADLVQPFAASSTYIVESDNDPVFTKGVIYYDDKGRVKWNKKRLSACWYTMSADKEGGSRTMTDTKFFTDVDFHLVDCDDETGAYPLWKSCSSSMVFEFWTTGGEKTTVSDLNLLSAWEYSPKQLKEHAEKKKQEIEIDEKEKVEGNNQSEVVAQ